MNRRRAAKAWRTPPISEDRNAKQEPWQRAVAMVHMQGSSSRSCSGTLVSCHGTTAVVCSSVDFPSQEVAAGARAIFYCDGSSVATVKARLEPGKLFAPTTSGRMLLIGVETDAVREAGVSPIRACPRALESLAASMTYVGKGPQMDVVVHLQHGQPKSTLSLHMDDYDVDSDRIYFSEKLPVEAHGGAVFYMRQLVGFLVETVGGPPQYTRKIAYAAGTRRLLSKFGAAGAGERSIDHDRIVGKLPVTSPYVVPRHVPPAFQGHAAKVSWKAEGGLRKSAGGLRATRGAFRDKVHDETADFAATLAVKAVSESNPVVLQRLCAQFGQAFLRDLRVAADWNLALVACSASPSSAPVLVTLRCLGVDLGHQTSPLRDTAAHVAAYHGNIPALRVLRAQGVPLDSPNSQNRLPAQKAADRGHADVVAWFQRHQIPVPEPYDEPDETPRECREITARALATESRVLPAPGTRFGTLLAPSS